MAIAQAYEVEQEHLARKNLQTPVSFIGSYKMIMPLAADSPSTSWKRAAIYAGTGLLLLAFWAFVTLTIYSLVFSTLILIPVWAIFTLQRRHKIQAARRVLAGRTLQAPPQVSPPHPPS